MKSRFRMLLAAITFFSGLALLFAALAIPLRLAAQDKQIPSLMPTCWGAGYCVNSGGHLNGYCIINTPYGCGTTQSLCCPVGAVPINPGTIVCCIHGNCGHAYVDLGRRCVHFTATPTPTPTVGPTATPTPTNT
jgi:hypothetical protein